MSLGLHQGTVFAERYRIERLLASGGMGAVYEAVHLATGRRRALKVMHPHVLDRADLRERFEREARVTAGVPSEHIVEVSDAGIDEATGTPFLVMELLQGEELGKRIKRVGRLPPEEAICYLRQTALALDATHRASIVHRDLKPGNVFLAERAGRAPEVKVLDFGIAKIIADGTTSGSATQTVGTPYYMAPEQFTGSKVSPATDLYALGMMAYTLLTGEAYWAEEKRESDNLLSFAMIAAAGPQEAATVRAGRRGVTLPAAFDGWFARATAVAPADRFGSATASIAALGEVFGVAVPPAGDVEKNAGATGDLETDTKLLTPALEATGSSTVTETRDTLTPDQEPGAARPSGAPLAAPVAVRAQRISRLVPRARTVSIVIALLGLLGVVLTVGLLVVLLRVQPEPEPPSPISPPEEPSAFLACPILIASGSKVDEPAGWLGAAAAAIVCERARLILGGRPERTLLPAELLKLPDVSADSFPADPFGAPDARKRSVDEACSRATAWTDGEVIKDGATFRVSLVIRRRDGVELGRGTASGRGLHAAIREAMTTLVGTEALPRAEAIDQLVAPWARSTNIDVALALLDLTFAMADNAGGLPEECARLDGISAEIAEMGPGSSSLCAYTLGQKRARVEVPLPPSSSAADYAAAARIDHMIGVPDNPAVADEIHRLFDQETSAWGRSELAAIESCLRQSSAPERAQEMAMVAIQEGPKNPDGLSCSPWGQLLSVTRDTPGANGMVRAMQAWEPWDSNGWLWEAAGPGDVAKALADARRAYLLSPLDANAADVLAGKLLAEGEREETRNVAVAIARGGFPVHIVESELIFVRIDASDALFGRALKRAKRASEVRPDDAGWVLVQRMEIAWRAVEVASVLGHAAQMADLFVQRFLDPEPPPLDGVYVSVPMRIPAICALASKPVARRCFSRFRSLKLAGRIPQTETFADGAERYANSDYAGAAKAWRPLLREPGMLASEIAGVMEETFEHTHETEQVDRLDELAFSRARELNGATPAHVRAARRAAARGDRDEARAQASTVIKAWSVADETVPAVAEMRQLLARIR